MSGWHALIVALLAMIAVWALFVIALLVAGRRSDARALAGFVPDCVVLFQRLLRDQRVPRGSKLLLGALVLYLLMPLDIVPDFIPVAGQLDDAILAALVLRRLLRSTDVAIVTEHWSGPPTSLALILRLAGQQPNSSATDVVPEANR